MTGQATIAQALDDGTAFLLERRPRTPRLDAEVLLAYVLGQNRTQLYVRAHDPLTPQNLKEFRGLLERRGEGVPVAYLVGSKEFYGRRFLVTPAVLVPRPESELLVEQAIRSVARSGLVRPRLLDLCTGSGCLAISLALEIAEAQVRATDLCPDALQVAAENLASHDLERRIKLYEGDLFEALPRSSPLFDVVVSNPPYVATDSGPRPEEAVVRNEPNLALFGGRDGLDLVRRIIGEAGQWLNPGGTLVLEMAPFQIEGMEGLMQEVGFCDTEILPDLSGLPRVLSGRWEA